MNTSGGITTIVGTGNGFTLGDGGPATSAQLANPQDVAVDSAGNIYIADLGNNRIRKVTAGIISSILTEGFGNCGGPLPAASSDVGFGVGLALDSAGDLYIADHFSDCVHQLNTTGTVTTVAGGGTNNPGDGGPATSAELGPVDAVALDSAGNLYIAESGFSRVRKVTSAVSVAPPVISAGGITNAASFATSVAPGSIVAVFGTFPIASATLSSFPLPTAVAGVSLEFGSAPLAPLFYECAASGDPGGYCAGDLHRQQPNRARGHSGFERSVGERDKSGGEGEVCADLLHGAGSGVEPARDRRARADQSAGGNDVSTGGDDGRDWGDGAVLRADAG